MPRTDGADRLATEYDGLATQYDGLAYPYNGVAMRSESPGITGVSWEAGAGSGPSRGFLSSAAAAPRRRPREDRAKGADATLGSTMTAAMPMKLTPEEYLAWERAQPEKHAYYRGEVFAMAGGSEEHNLLVFNIIALLGVALRDRPCRGYPSDMRVRVVAADLYTYPDVTIVCGNRELDGDTLLNPHVIFEVLSDSTEAYDRGRKFEHYRTIPSFKEYVLVSQHEVHVDHFVKQPDGSWLMRSRGPGETIALASVGCALPVDEVYLKVLPPPG